MLKVKRLTNSTNDNKKFEEMIETYLRDYDIDLGTLVDIKYNGTSVLIIYDVEPENKKVFDKESPENE